jgi:hypothetical protein
MTATASSCDGQCAAAELLIAEPKPLAELEMRHQLAREAYERGRADGDREGYERAEADMARRWREIAAPIARGGIRNKELKARRRGSGNRTGAEILAEARASLVPLSDGMVELGGPAVHHHRCTNACNAYQPGRYSPKRAAEILATLPGDYHGAIAELRERCAV